MPIATVTIEAELKYVVESVKVIPICKETALKSAAKYCRSVVKRVNVSEEAHDKKSKKSRT